MQTLGRFIYCTDAIYRFCSNLGGNVERKMGVTVSTNLSRRRWSPRQNWSPPGTSTAAVIGPPLPRMVPSHETLHALVFRRDMVSQQVISVFSTAGHNLHARSMV